MKVREIWKDIPGYEKKYMVSNFGRVKSMQYHLGGPKLLKLRKITSGYRGVILHKEGIAKPAKVHRLVAVAFVPNPLNKPCVNHLDNLPSNNKVDNLEWCTYRENSLHSMKQRRHSFGERSGMAKLTSSQVKKIRVLYLSGWRNLQLANRYGLSRQYVGNIIRREYWAHI